MNTAIELRFANADVIPEASDFVFTALNDNGIQNDCVETLGNEFTNRLERYPQNTLFAIDNSNNDSIVGFLELDPDKSSNGHHFIRNLYVLPPYRKQGIATNLVNKMLEEKCASGEELLVEVSNENDKNYWEKLQFTTNLYVLSLKIK